jgi:hypothetical protein
MDVWFLVTTHAPCKGLNLKIRIAAMDEFAGANECRSQDEAGHGSVGLQADVARRVCLISRTPASRLGLSDDGFCAGLAIERTEDMASAVRRLASRRSGCSLVFVNFDDFSGESITIDLLRRLRSRSPNLLIILLSRKLQADDLSQERLAITDISLVAPIPDIGLIGPALETAAVNNAAWRKRRRSLMLEKTRQMS